MENYSIEKPSAGIHQREYYVSLILPAEALKARWEMINYKPGQLSLEL